jgi:hypothetical protein
MSFGKETFLPGETFSWGLKGRGAGAGAGDGLAVDDPAPVDGVSLRVGSAGGFAVSCASAKSAAAASRNNAGATATKRILLLRVHISHDPES